MPADAPLSHPHLYFNRELSWIDFNWRVLYQAMRADLPLLERVRFLSITESNLDEFIRKRLGGLERQKRAGVLVLSRDGRTPSEQLSLLRDAVDRMQAAMVRLWRNELQPGLRTVGIEILAYDELTPAERRHLHDHFQQSVYPILTPLAVDTGHPFPFISNLSLSFAILARHPGREAVHFARVKVPTTRGRFVQVDATGHRFLPLEQLIAAHIDELFRGLQVDGAYLFRVTRNADLARDEEEAEDLLQMIGEELRERRFAPVVRLEVERSMPIEVRRLLCSEMDIDSEEVVEIDGLLGLTDLGRIADLPIAQHRFEPWEPVAPPALSQETDADPSADIFTVIRRGDLLVHHPYDSFTASVQHFIERAAEDERVLAIKLTLYRTSTDSPVIRALIRAAEAGKQVAVLVEVTARFDEESNIEWAEMLESHGVHVTYGVVGLKTHTKVTLIVREDEDGIRTYCHIGTGNYHSTTARLYSDLGLLTADRQIGFDVVDLFHFLTGYSPEQHYDRMIVAPRFMRKAFADLIEREVTHQREGRGGRILAKMNAIDDDAVVEQLYAAAREGVQIDLVVRGHCSLRPGLPGFSENIRVISIVGRFLEHSRIFWFGNGGEPQVFIGSADWRRRNLEERVEAVVPVQDPALAARLRAILDLALADNSNAWELKPDGRYVLRTARPGEERRDFHETLMRMAREAAAPHWLDAGDATGAGAAS